MSVAHNNSFLVPSFLAPPSARLCCVLRATGAGDCIPACHLRRDERELDRVQRARHVLAGHRRNRRLHLPGGLRRQRVPVFRRGHVQVSCAITLCFCSFLSDTWAFLKNVFHFPSRASLPPSGNGQALASGACQCRAGFTGASCNSCAADYYSYPTCRYCVASITCSNQGTCTSTGTCQCVNSLLQQPDCRNCLTNYYNPPTCTRCEAGVDNMTYGCYARGTCNSMGACVCADYTRITGTRCEQCRSGYYGRSCLACPNNGLGVCSGATRGTCNDGALGTGTCACRTGYSGTACSDPAVFTTSVLLATTPLTVPSEGRWTLGDNSEVTLKLDGDLLLPAGVTAVTANANWVDIGSAVAVRCSQASTPTTNSFTCFVPASQPNTNSVAALTYRRQDGVSVALPVSLRYTAPVITSLRRNGLDVNSGPTTGIDPALLTPFILTVSYVLTNLLAGVDFSCAFRLFFFFFFLFLRFSFPFQNFLFSSSLLPPSPHLSTLAL